MGLALSEIQFQTSLTEGLEMKSGTALRTLPLTAALAGGTAAQANLLTNGSFESGAFVNRGNDTMSLVDGLTYSLSFDLGSSTFWGRPDSITASAAGTSLTFISPSAARRQCNASRGSINQIGGIAVIGRIAVRNLFACCGFALALLCAQEGANGAVVVNLSVVGDDVVAEGGGTLNLDALTFDSQAPFAGAFLNPDLGVIIVGPAAAAGSLYTGISGPAGPAAFGGGDAIIADSVSGSGDVFGVGQGDLTELLVPEGYVSGSTLLAKTTWVGVNLGTLDLTPGTYVWR